MIANVRSIEAANYTFDSPPAIARQQGDMMGVQPVLPKPTDPDQDKGAVEGDRPTDKQHSQPECDSGLDEDGLPKDRIAIAEDVIGANADETQG